MYRRRPNSIKSINVAKKGLKAIVRRVAPEYSFYKKEENKFKFRYNKQNQKKNSLTELSISKQKNGYTVEIEALLNFNEISLNFNTTLHIFKLEELGFEETAAYKPEEGAKIYYQKENIEEGELEKILEEINL